MRATRVSASGLRAAVENITPGSEITLQGITIDTTSATLLSSAGDALSASEFYGRLAVGDELLVLDAQVPDGTADSVRFVEPN